MRAVLSAYGLAAMLFTAPALAETHAFGPFFVDDSAPEVVVLAGEIQHNSALDFRRALRAYPQAYLLALHSQGEDVSAGLLIAQDVYDRGIRTYIGPESECYSACAYVFFAGRDRLVEGKLGVHQIASEKPDLYSAQVAISDILDNMTTFEVPMSVISEMFRTSPDSMRVYSAAEATKLGLNRGSIELAETDAPPVAADGQKEGQVPQPARAFLLEGRGGTTRSPDMIPGSVWWSKGRDTEGEPTIVAEASFPGRGIELKMTWRENRDAELPTPVLVEALFSASSKFTDNRITSLAGILLKDHELVPGDPLVGAAALIEGDDFLFALSAAPTDVRDNFELLEGNRWMDLAISYASGVNAIVSLEKDAGAAEIFRQLLPKWRGD